MLSQKKYTLITGASSGLGKEFAVQCARQRMHLLLIALPGSNLAMLASNLMDTYAVDIRIFEFDLTDTTVFAERINHVTSHYSIDFLINNAGVGGTANMVDCSIDSIDRIIQLNIRTTVVITRLLLPCLLQHTKSYILNIASMAAFTPIAYKTIYPASKAFISSFALGLREELHNTGVSVSVVYPGPIMTNSNTSRRIVLQGLKARMGLLSTSSIVETAIKQTLAGKASIVPGWWNRMNQQLMNLLPVKTKTRMVSGAVKNELTLSI